MRKIDLSLVLIIGMCSVMMISCYKDNEEDLYPLISDCDTTDMFYATDIVPVISNFCYACHGSSNYTSLGGNIELEGYGNLKIQVDNGLFSGSIIQDGSASFMPRNANKLNACTISQITAWIEQGAKNN